MEYARNGNPATQPNPGNYIVVVLETSQSIFFSRFEGIQKQPLANEQEQNRKQEKKKEQKDGYAGANDNANCWILCVGYQNDQPIFLVIENPNETLAWAFCPKDKVLQAAKMCIQPGRTDKGLQMRMLGLAGTTGVKVVVGAAALEAVFAGSATAGLAMLGGGSVAAGGFGMMGGIATLSGATGAVAAHTAVQACQKLDTTSQNTRAVRAGGIAGAVAGVGASGAAVVSSAAAGTGGAAVVTSGLSSLGGGALAAGGYGILGGVGAIMAIPVATVAVASGAGYLLSSFQSEKINNARYRELYILADVLHYQFLPNRATFPPPGF